MKMRALLILAFAAALSLCSVVALSADAPAAAPAKAEMPKSDRWFVLAIEKNPPMTGYIRITIKASGMAEAPVQVVYEINIPDSNVQTLTALCRNDEWLSPVHITTMDAIAHTASTAAITRPDPNSTAGRVAWTGSNNPANLDVKEHSVLTFTPLDLAARLPFEKGKVVEFAAYHPMFDSPRDCTLSYAGEEEAEIKGQKQRLHKIAQRAFEKEEAAYWFNAKHELIRMTFEGALLTPATEAEARKAAGMEANPDPAVKPDLAAKMSEAVTGCLMIRIQMRAYLTVNGQFPIFKEAGGKEFAAKLNMGPAYLDGKFFKAADYVVNSTAAAYTIKATLGAETYIINQDGMESGTYKTGQ